MVIIIMILKGVIMLLIGKTAIIAAPINNKMNDDDDDDDECCSVRSGYCSSGFRDNCRMRTERERKRGEAQTTAERRHKVNS